MYQHTCLGNQDIVSWTKRFCIQTTVTKNAAAFLKTAWPKYRLATSTILLSWKAEYNGQSLSAASYSVNTSLMITFLVFHLSIDKQKQVSSNCFLWKTIFWIFCNSMHNIQWSSLVDISVRYRSSRSRSPVRKKHRSSSRSPRRGGGSAAPLPATTKKHNINNASRLMQLANYSADTIKEVQYKLTRK